MVSPRLSVHGAAGMRTSWTVAELDAWLEGMRTPRGYGGPVVHWWQNSLGYCGAGLDWRYEGIISGYVSLWQRTGDRIWLDKAKRAGGDLVRGMTPTGNFLNSSFEQNPCAGGTPHEAAASLALFQLASVLREDNDQDWSCYADAAENNLQAYHIGRLWDEEAQSFRDSPNIPSLVPNKACTLVEALFAWATIRGTDEAIEQFALPTMRAVVGMQLEGPPRLAGAIAQNHIRGQVVEAYFPYYVARCIPALVATYEYTEDGGWLDAAVNAAQFIMRHQRADGFLPQVLYATGSNEYPQWIAPLGDVLRALDRLRPYGFSARTATMEDALHSGQLPTGGWATARGFAAQISQRFNKMELPDFRDNLPVSGWVDKVFAYLATCVPASMSLPTVEVNDASIACDIRGRLATWTETATEMSLRSDNCLLYRWEKGEAWPDVMAPEVMWK